MVDSYRSSYYNSPTNNSKTTITTNNSGLELTLFILAIFFFFSLQKINILSLIFHPINTIAGLLEMTIWKLSEASEKFGIGGLGKVDWDKNVADPLGTEMKNGIPRNYNDESPIAGGSKGQYYPGLLNAAGNLCFLNATLQSMASTPHLLLYLRRIISLSNSLSPAFPTPVTTALLETLTALNTPSTYYPSPLRPIALANALAHSSSLRMELLSSNDQQDSHELWVMIKTAVEEDAMKVEQEFKKRNEGGLADILSLTLGGVGSLGEKKEGKKSVRDPFTHLMSQKITCMICKYTRDVMHIVEDHVGVIVPPLENTRMELLSEYTCRRCSLSATLDKLLAQRDRLALPSSTQTPPLSTSTSNPSIATESSFAIPSTPSTPTMTQSRKDRKKKVQKLVDRVQAVIDTGDYEKELGADIKVEKVVGPAGKKIRFARAPNILTFHLRRSDYYGRHGAIKNLCRVVFPEYLDLTPYSDYPNSNSSSSFPSTAASEQSASQTNRDMYRLSSLVVHYGSHSFGHYVAFRRSPHSSTSYPLPPATTPQEESSPESISSLDSFSTLSEPSTPPSRERPEWYRVSDENVQPSTLAEVLHGNPTLVFYERVGGELGDMGADAGEAVDSIRKLGRGARGIIPRLVESWKLDKAIAVPVVDDERLTEVVV